VEPSLTLAIEIPYDAITQPLSAFAQAFAFVDVEIRHPLDGDVSALVRQGQAQLGLAFSQPNYPRELGFVQMGKLVMSHVAASSHPLACQGSVSFAELHRHRRLAFSVHSEGLPSTEYLRSPRCWRAESYLALLEMTRAGLGWATLPRRLVLAEIERGNWWSCASRPIRIPTGWWGWICSGIGAAGPARWLRDELARSRITERDSAGHPTTF
jgi:DNA-binding transcriptional LysR family regulator